MKKIVIGIPTNNNKEYCLDEFIDSVNKLEYPRLELFIHDDSERDDYAEQLKGSFEHETTIVHRPRPDDINIFEWLVKVRNRIRRYFLKSRAWHMFMLDSDVILTQEAFDKTLNEMRKGTHWAGPWCEFGWGDEGQFEEDTMLPMVMKSGRIQAESNLDVYTHKELEKQPDTFQCHGIPLACSMVSRFIMQKNPFVWCKILPLGEDLWWINNANEKGFKATCINTKLKHLTHNWDEFVDQKKIPKGLNIETVVRTGDEICKTVDIEEERKKDKTRKKAKAKKAKEKKEKKKKRKTKKSSKKSKSSKKN